MDKKPNWWQRRKISVQMGQPTAQWKDLGQLKAHTVIRYKDWFVDVMELEDGALSVSWSADPHMFPDVNINDFWTAAPPAPEKGTE